MVDQQRSTVDQLLHCSNPALRWYPTCQSPDTGRSNIYSTTRAKVSLSHFYFPANHIEERVTLIWSTDARSYDKTNHILLSLLGFDGDEASVVTFAL